MNKDEIDRALDIICDENRYPLLLLTVDSIKEQLRQHDKDLLSDEMKVDIAYIADWLPSILKLYDRTRKSLQDNETKHRLDWLISEIMIAAVTIGKAMRGASAIKNAARARRTRVDPVLEASFIEAADKFKDLMVKPEKAAEAISMELKGALSTKAVRERLIKRGDTPPRKARVRRSGSSSM